jgi:hypothetical protein
MFLRSLRLQQAIVLANAKQTLRSKQPGSKQPGSKQPGSKQGQVHS